MARRLIGQACLFIVLGLAACAGHPVQIGIYTPYPREEMMGEIQKKVVELGYTIQRTDTVNFELVADRQLAQPIDGADREELFIRIAPDNSGSTKLTITSARILPATANRPVQRVTASSRTNADANAVLQMYMKARKSTRAS